MVQNAKFNQRGRISKRAFLFQNYGFWVQLQNHIFTANYSVEKPQASRMSLIQAFLDNSFCLGIESWELNIHFLKCSSLSAAGPLVLLSNPNWSVKKFEHLSVVLSPPVNCFCWIKVCDIMIHVVVLFHLIHNLSVNQEAWHVLMPQFVILIRTYRDNPAGAYKLASYYHKFATLWTLLSCASRAIFQFWGK